MTVFEMHAAAPGKIMWLGGYSVLERPNLAFVTAIDSHVHISARKNHDNAMVLSAPQIIAQQARGTMDINTGKLTMEIPTELKLLKTSVELAMMYLAATGHKTSGIDIVTRNDRAFVYRIGNNGVGKNVSKSGMGSSAAVAAAATGAVLELFNGDSLGLEDVHRLAQLAHSVATGKYGSGFDVAAAVHGSIVYSRYSPSLFRDFPSVDYTKDDVLETVKCRWDHSIEPLAVPSILVPVVANFLGGAAITTSFVKKVNEFRLSCPLQYNEAIARINGYNSTAIEILRRAGEEHGHGEDALLGLYDAFESGRQETRRLGELSGADIEPSSASELIERSKMAGALVAKLPGAGGMDSIAALCRGGEDADRLRRFWGLQSGLEVLSVGLQRGGLSVSKESKICVMA